TVVGRRRKMNPSQFATDIMEDIEAQPLQTKFSPRVKLGVLVFLLGVGLILMFGIFSDLVPTFKVNGETVKLETTEIVQLFMYMSAAINLVLVKLNTRDILDSHITQSAIGALFAVLGPGWLGATIF